MQERFIRTQVALGVSLVAVLAAGQFAFTQTKDAGKSADSNATSSTPATTGSGTAAAPAAPLQGGVQHLTVSLEQLRDVGTDLKQVLKASSSLYDEVTIQPVNLVTEPEVVGRGTIIYIPIGSTPAGPVAPARKDRVDAAMNHMRPIIDTMKANVDAVVSGSAHLDLPDDILQQLKPQFKTWIADVDETAVDLNKLNQLTSVTPPYDQPAIAAAAQAINANVKDLDKTRREIYKVIRKQAKHIADETKS